MLWQQTTRGSFKMFVKKTKAYLPLKLHDCHKLNGVVVQGTAKQYLSKMAKIFPNLVKTIKPTN